MEKTRFFGGCLLLAPASILALSVGCATPVDPDEDLVLEDTQSGTSEDIGDTSDELGVWGNRGLDGWVDIGIPAYSAPSVAVLGSTPYMAFIGADNKCFLSSHGGSAWGAPVAIPGCVGPAAPSIGVHGNTLYAGYLGAGGGCFLNTYGDVGWGSPSGLSGCGDAFAPIVAPFSSTLGVVYGGAGGSLYHTTCGAGIGGFGNCGAGVVIPGVNTLLAPSVGIYSDQLALAYTGLDHQVFYTTYGGVGGWANPLLVPGCRSTFSPFLGWGPDALYLGVPGYRGGLGWSPFTGGGWGRFSRWSLPFRGAAYGLGYLGPNLGFNAFAANRGRLFMRPFALGGGFGYGGYGLGRGFGLDRW